MDPTKPIDDVLSEDDDGILASECATEYEEEEDGEADVLEETNGVGDEEAEEIEEEWEDDAVDDGHDIGDDDLCVPTRWRPRPKKEKKARTYEGSPLRSESDDDIF
jgi:hypothetical protein